MKNYFLLLLVICTASFAQDKPQFGVNLGGTYSNVRTNNFNDQIVSFKDSKYDVNFLVGVSIEIPLNEKFSFVGNINYERKSYKRNAVFSQSNFEDFDPILDNRTYVSEEYKTRLEYITVPLNMKYYIDSEKKFYVNGGPFLGFFFNSNYKTDGENSGDGNDNFKTLDFGVNLGIGTNFKINDKSSLNLEIRHNYGLIDINKIESTPTFTAFVSYVKTNSFNLIANYQFDL
ncbi:porin family protein [Flavobacterium sp. PLA-1-15]|uniref:porin family protein n=1 Tax=Flavobacterium sp. PLA-1-15 TaxID=3380533 RepID=UPI003B7E1B5F